MRIYIAGPLFNEMEISRNREICNQLENEGFQTYLPQRDGGVFYELRNKGVPDKEIRQIIFYCDYQAILDCDIIICLLDGRVLDEGMCVELGIAYALNKHCIGYKTDIRTQDKFGNNIMIDCTLDKIFNAFEQLLDYLMIVRNRESCLGVGRSNEVNPV